MKGFLRTLICGSMLVMGMSAQAGNFSICSQANNKQAAVNVQGFVSEAGLYNVYTTTGIRVGQVSVDQSGAITPVILSSRFKSGTYVLKNTTNSQSTYTVYLK